VIASVAGFFTGLSLIIAIGAQNAYVLRLGLMRHHVFAAVLFCAISDALLIIAGVAGLGAVIQQLPLLLEIFRYAGAAYLIWFGISAVRRAMKPSSLEAQGEALPLLKTLATMAALTWLNPHVYLDTVILLGSIGNQFEPGQWWFALGAATASFVWFFSLGYGAKLLSRFMASERFWQVLDIVIALVMFSIALTLLFSDL
jgi:L-lysine exporter family protein LysE/ArgO